MQRLRFLVWKEFLELRKDPKLFGIVVIGPILQLTLLGYAATTDVRDVPVVVADGDRSSQSRDVIARFDASRNFNVIDVVATSSDVEPFLEHGEASLALSIPAGYGADVASGTPVTLQVIADGSDSNSTTVALGYATSLLGSYTQELLEARSIVVQPDAGGAPRAAGIEPRIRVWFNPQLESRHFMIPGVLALVLLVVTANLASMAIVREKELGTLEQLNVTPLRRWELVVGKLLPYGLIAMVDVLVPDSAPRQLSAAARDEPALRPLHARARTVHFDDLRDAAAGDDDGDLLLPDADDLPLGVHLPDREHAGGDARGDLSDTAALLSGDRAGDLSEGDRAGPVVAPGGSAGRLGDRRAFTGRGAQPEARRVSANRTSAAPYLGATVSVLMTRFTPLVDFAICSARLLPARDATVPFSVTT